MNDIVLAIFGIVLMVIGVVVTAVTMTGMIEQIKLFEFLPAMQRYFIGTFIAIVCFVAGLLMLAFALRS